MLKISKEKYSHDMTALETNLFPVLNPSVSISSNNSQREIVFLSFANGKIILLLPNSRKL